MALDFRAGIRASARVMAHSQLGQATITDEVVHPLYRMVSDMKEKIAAFAPEREDRDLSTRSVNSLRFVVYAESCAQVMAHYQRPTECIPESIENMAQVIRMVGLISRHANEFNRFFNDFHLEGEVLSACAAGRKAFRSHEQTVGLIQRWHERMAELSLPDLPVPLDSERVRDYSSAACISYESLKRDVANAAQAGLAVRDRMLDIWMRRYGGIQNQHACTEIRRGLLDFCVQDADVKMGLRPPEANAHQKLAAYQTLRMLGV